MACRRALLPPAFPHVASAAWFANGVTATAPLRRGLCIAATAASSTTAPAPRPTRGRRGPARPLGPLPLVRRSHSKQNHVYTPWEFKDIQQVAKARREGSGSAVVLVDTREPSELQSTGRIPTAINIPITSQPDSFHITDEEFEDRFGFARPARDAELVFYCKAGVRSRAAATLAKEAGWENVGEYSGSWLDWEKNGGEIER